MVCLNKFVTKVGASFKGELRFFKEKSVVIEKWLMFKDRLFDFVR